MRSPSEVNGEVFEELHRATYFDFQTNREVHCHESLASLSSHPLLLPPSPLSLTVLIFCVFFYGGSIPVFGRQTVDVAFQFPCKFAATFHLRVDLYHVLIFVPKQMVWLPVPWSFNTCSDVMACTGMQGQCEHCKTVCAERWLGQKSLAALGSQSWLSNTLGCRSTNWAASLPELLVLTSVCSEHVLTWTIFSDVSCRAWWAQKWGWWVSPVRK